MSKLITSLAFVSLSGFAFAADDVRGDYPEEPPHTPEQEQKMFHLPPGFEIQLVASEPQIQKPINLNFDALGRLWVSGSEQYPWPAATDATGAPIPNFDKTYQDIANAFAGGRKPPEPSSIGKDSIRVLSDFDETGRAGKISVFAEGLNIPSGIQPLPRAAGSAGDAVIAYSIPYIWRLEDTTGNGKADRREILYGPFGFLDTHGGSSSYIQWIDGWIYGTHGFRNHSEVKDRKGVVTVFDSGNVYRFKPDGSRIEHYTHGQTNPFGLAFDPLGDLYSADSHSKPVYLLLRGGYYEGIGKRHDGLGFAPRITDDDHGSSAIGGMMYYADDRWPKEFWGDTFNGNVVTHRINRDKLEWRGATPKAIRQPDFLVSDDKWFRPVNFKLGPDGALWIADFYSPIIGHYEVPLTDPHRDHLHGRIWRVVYRGEKKEGESQGKAWPFPEDLSKIETARLSEKLSSPNVELRRLAINEMVARGGNDVIQSLHHLAAAPPSESAGTVDAQMTATGLALWGLERLGGLDETTLAQNFRNGNSNVKRQALAILADRKDWQSKELDGLVAEALHGSDGAVARAAAEALAQQTVPEKTARNVQALLTTLKSASRDDAELVYAARVALRNQLLAPNGFNEAAKLTAADPSADGQIADVCLGAPTAESAEFLLAYLDRTKLGANRTGDILALAAQNIAPDRIPALVALARKYPDAPLDKRLAAADALSQAARIRGLQLSPDASEWLETVMLAALASPDEGTLKRGIEAVRNGKNPAKLAPLRQIVADPKRPSELRATALDALANVDPAGEALAAALADTSSMTVRKRAAELLGQLNTEPTRIALNNALATAPWDLATSVGGALAKSDAGAELLLTSIEAGKASPALLRNNAVAGPFHARPAPLQERAAALAKDLPPEDARLDKVIAERALQFRSAQPNAEHGQQVFQQNCFSCHRIKNNGGNIGPNLDGIGSRGVNRLVEDILDPSRNVDPAFRQTILEIADGRTLSGVGLHESGQLLVMSDATGKEVSVEKDQVRKRSVSLVSLMPPNFEQVLSQSDLNDLLSFLISQSAAAK